jgi:hypothetical protein
MVSGRRSRHASGPSLRGKAFPYSPAVYEELISIIGRYHNGEAVWQDVQLKSPAEVDNGKFGSRSRWVGDPAGGPRVGSPVLGGAGVTGEAQYQHNQYFQ